MELVLGMGDGNGVRDGDELEIGRRWRLGWL